MVVLCLLTPSLPAPGRSPLSDSSYSLSRASRSLHIQVHEPCQPVPPGFPLPLRATQRPKWGRVWEGSGGLSQQHGPPHGKRPEVSSHLLLISTRPRPPSTESGPWDKRGVEPRGLLTPPPAIGHMLPLRGALRAQKGAASSLILSLAPLLLSHLAIFSYFSLASNTYYSVHKKHHQTHVLNTFGCPYCCI